MLKFCSCVLLASLVTAVFGVDESVTKTWELTIPDADNGGCTNNAVITLTDGNYELTGWIRSATAKTLSIGRRNAATEVAGLALRKDEDGKYIGSGDLDMRGTITVGGAPSSWKITYISEYAFSGVGAAPFDTVFCPTTLTGMANATFQNCGSHRRFVLHAPDMTGDLPNNTFLSSSGPKVVDLKIPKVTCIGGYWIRSDYDNFLSETDVSDWDLSSVQFIATGSHKGQYDPGYLFRWGSFRGTMRLPSLKWLNPTSFQHCRYMNALEVGRNGTLEYVGRFAVTNCAMLGSIMLGGKDSGWIVSTNAFYSANITNVTFLTTPPSYEEPDSIIFGTEATEARQIAFYIPRPGTTGWKTRWARFVAAARPATQEERAAFSTRFGTAAAAGLVGIVGPEVFRTAREQWLVYGVSPATRFTVKAALLDPRFEGDRVDVSPPPDADGRYAVGTEVTLTAVPNAEKGQFVRWRGAGISEAEEGNATLTLTVDRDFDVTAQMAHDWTFRLNDPEAGFSNGKQGTISNQIWKLNVTVSDAAKGTILYGTNTQGGAWTEMGEGMLDLNGRVFRDSDELRITGFKGQAFKGSKNDNGAQVIPNARYPRAFVMRENLSANPEQNFRGTSWDAIVTNLVYECPDLAIDMGTDGFCLFTTTAGRQRLPKITRVFSTYSEAWKMSRPIDVSDWRFDSVTNVVGEVKGQWGTYRGVFTGQSYVGTLHLPALSEVQTNGFNNTMNMEAIELGSNTVVTKIGTLAFNGCSSLSRIQLRAGKDLTVGANAFTGTAKLKMLEFTYELPTDPVAVDNMLVGSTEALEVSANPPVIYASRLMGWNGGKTARIRRATDAELAARPWWVRNDSTLIGVWVTADDVAKAWVVHVPCPEDPKGTILLFR